MTKHLKATQVSDGYVVELTEFHHCRTGKDLDDMIRYLNLTQDEVCIIPFSTHD